MSFGDIELLVAFLPVVWLVHWLLPRRAGLQNAWLLAASLLFYFTWHPRLVLLFAANTVVTWIVVRRLAPGAAGRSRAWLIAGIVWSFALLGVLKYAGFFTGGLARMLSAAGLTVSAPTLELVVPIGISFWTLQVVGAMLDVWWGRAKPPSGWLSWATFVSFFPQLMAGPIPRAVQLLAQLEVPRALSASSVARGAATFMGGFVLTYLVAATLGPTLVDPVFAEPARFGAMAHWAALFGYAGQVFADFAGYSLMAIGCGRLFSLELPENFRQPFISKNLLELWRRWHITLNQWLFDYLYTPAITGRGWLRGRYDVAFLLVFGFSGLWHGAAMTFVVWGLLHGVGLSVHRRFDVRVRGLCRKDRSWVTRRKSRGWALWSWALTQGFFVLTLVPFRASGLGVAGTFAAGLVGAGGTDGVVFETAVAKLNVLICLGILVVMHLLALGRLPAVRERAAALPAPVRGVAWGLVVVYLLLFMPVASGTFIYAQF